ncbi:hypothetical protein MHYP_G00247760 [Metynnis hypsauchen]
MYDKRDWKSIDLCFLSILNMFQQHPTGMETGIATATVRIVSYSRTLLTVSRGNPVTPRTKPSSEHHANLQADWQRRAASLPAPLSGSPRRNLKPPSLTPRHPLTTDSSSEGLPAPKLHSWVGKRPKLDINSAGSPV